MSSTDISTNNQQGFRWHIHTEREPDHAFLSPSQYSWTNYDMDKLRERWYNEKAKERGTRLHAFASEAIQLGIRLEDTEQTINKFVKDVIGFGMKSEFKLKYSQHCYGTADAISFDGKLLRIFDLKTGFVPAHMTQLKVYAALFCLEYNFAPSKIDMELRIYQSDDIVVEIPDPLEIKMLMAHIRKCSKLLDKLQMEEVT